MGNLGRDPESRSFQNGGKVVELRIATSESWKDKNSGERKEKTEWHTVKVFQEGLANVAERYLRKGSKVYIEGALTTRKWQDPQGNDRYSTEIVLQGFNGVLTMLDGAPGQGGAGGGGGGGGYQAAAAATTLAAATISPATARAAAATSTRVRRRARVRPRATTSVVATATIWMMMCRFKRSAARGVPPRDSRKHGRRT